MEEGLQAVEQLENRVIQQPEAGKSILQVPEVQVQDKLLQPAAQDSQRLPVPELRRAVRSEEQLRRVETENHQ